MFKENKKDTEGMLSSALETCGEDATHDLPAERDLLIGILETLSQSRHINEYLERLVE